MIEKELDNIRALEEAFDPAAFSAAGAAIAAARTVLVCGTRSTASLAHHLWFGLNKLALTAERALTTDAEAFEQVLRLPEGGCVVVIGFPRYLSGLADLLAYARERGLRTVAITDSPFSPLQGDVSLYAPAESASFVAFHSAPLILINALLHELAREGAGRTVTALERFETLAAKRNLFHQS